jgi:hypothetical protein
LEAVIVLMTGGGGLAAEREPSVKANVITVKTVRKECLRETV